MDKGHTLRSAREAIRIYLFHVFIIELDEGELHYRVSYEKFRSSQTRWREHMKRVSF